MGAAAAREMHQIPGQPIGSEDSENS
jgi:hypothetical protein